LPENVSDYLYIIELASVKNLATRIRHRDCWA